MSRRNAKRASFYRAEKVARRVEQSNARAMQRSMMRRELRRSGGIDLDVDVTCLGDSRQMTVLDRLVDDALPAIRPLDNGTAPWRHPGWYVSRR